MRVPLTLNGFVCFVIKRLRQMFHSTSSSGETGHLRTVTQQMAIACLLSLMEGRLFESASRRVGAFLMGELGMRYQCGNGRTANAI